jgi:hypothetical protein
LDGAEWPHDPAEGTEAPEGDADELAAPVNGAQAVCPAESGWDSPEPVEMAAADDASAQVPGTVPADPGAAAVARRGPETIEIDMRPVKSFADLARVTKLLGGIAPGAQPVDLNLPQHRALFSVRGRDREALATQLADALPEANVVERENGIDVLLGDDDS